MSLRDKKIGVMMGGLSAERGISLKSGKAVARALTEGGWDVVTLEVVEETQAAIRELIIRYAVDIVLITMHGGFGEDGRLQHILEKMNIPYSGPGEEASRIAMDKVASRRLFEKARLSVPKAKIIRRGAEHVMLDSLCYPLVVKPSAQGSSIGVSFIHSPHQLSGALAEAFKFGDAVLIEEFIKGREVTVSILDGRALPIVEIIPKKQFFDFQAKYEPGLTEYLVPASFSVDQTQRIQGDALAAYRALNCRHLSRVDLMVDEQGTPYVLEVNTIPGMTETSLLPKAAKACGIDFTQLCTKLVELADAKK